MTIRPSELIRATPLWCDACQNTGAIDCLCGGDLCLCGSETVPCPECDGANAGVDLDDEDLLS